LDLCLPPLSVLILKIDTAETAIFQALGTG
jgi:hypothetical protein